MDGELQQKMWGGRFAEDVDPDFHNLNASINIDKRIYAEDIQGNIAYAHALCKIKLLSQEEVQAINVAFKQIQDEWDNGKFIINLKDEDIHSANERRLSVLIIQAEQDIDILMPGYTHMQRAQPIRWSQWLLSYAWYMKQDLEKLLEVRKHVNILPLGSGAIAGNPFSIDRQFLAMELGFDDITQNSMHAVGDRDFVAEFLFWSSLSTVHLSRFCEDLIMYSTREFNFVKFADKYSTGSSLMPQKRNPDFMELIRGKTGTILGKCLGFMITLKGIPSTYNKDLQEDKEMLFHVYDTLYKIFHIAKKALATLKISREDCKNALTSDMLATDMAYYLVNKGGKINANTVRMREARVMRDILVNVVDVWKTKRRKGSTTACSMKELNIFLVEEKLSASMSEEIMTEETFREWLEDFKGYTSRRPTLRIDASTMTATKTSSSSGGGGGGDSLNALFAGSSFKEEETDERLSQCISKLENGRLHTVKTPGEVGHSLIRLDVYEVWDILRKEKRDWWKYAKMRKQILTMLPTDPKQLLVKQFLDLAAEDLIGVSGLRNEIGSVPFQ